jgi:hypothetical protein
MELRDNIVRVSTRSLVLIVALFCALAIGLTGAYVLRGQSAQTRLLVTQPFAFDHEVPGPDSAKYKPVPVPEREIGWNRGH